MTGTFSGDFRAGYADAVEGFEPARNAVALTNGYWRGWAVAQGDAERRANQERSETYWLGYRQGRRAELAARRAA